MDEFSNVAILHVRAEGTIELDVRKSRQEAAGVVLWVTVVARPVERRANRRAVTDMTNSIRCTGW